MLIAVNRKSRSGKSDLGSALDTLSTALGPVETLDIDDPGQLASRLASACGPQVERIVVAGGDGTVSSALPVVLSTGVRLGILPLGTANDFARTLGVPEDPDAAADIIVAGRTRRIDVGVVNGRHFINAAGIGFSADLQQALSPRAKRMLGPFAYPAGVLSRWRKHRPFSVDIHGEGIAMRRRVIQVTIANGRFYGGGMTAEREARIDDAGLDILLILPRPWWRHVSSVIRLRRGVYTTESPVIAKRCTAFVLTTRHPKWISTDGERTTLTPASFSVLPAALEVFAP